MGKKLTVRLVRGVAGRTKKQIGTLRALGLRKPNDVVVKDDCPEIRGMIRKVGHLVEVEE